ncbi:MAG: hypothetical protein JSU63_10675 [Phycisphaerales bacterium]|nr:MAG: hypothetical protein JSU63_10675 [Phycisphaerales bacterium]
MRIGITRHSSRFLTLAAFLYLTTGGSSSGETPRETLQRLEKQQDRMNTLFLATTRTEQRDGVHKETVARTFKKRVGSVWLTRQESRTTTTDKTRKQKSLSESLRVSDGVSEWTETRLDGQTIVLKSKPVVTSAFTEVWALLKNGTAKMKERETVKGQPCVVLEIAGETGSIPYRVTYWISERHGLILKKRHVWAGRGTAELRTSALALDEPIADSEFAYALPPDARVIDAGTIGNKQPREPDKKD